MEKRRDPRDSRPLLVPLESLGNFHSSLRIPGSLLSASYEVQLRPFASIILGTSFPLSFPGAEPVRGQRGMHGLRWGPRAHL